MLERQELDAAKIVRVAVQVPQAPLHDGTHSDMVASGMVVECNRQLNQSLPEFFLLGWSGAPEIFQNFVGLKEKGAIKKRDSTGQFARVHALLCHKPGRPYSEHLDKE
jgi:hypothetical protein